MDIELRGSFKSLAPFSWNGVPDFAVLTGPNGCGKTHLLQLLACGTIGQSNGELIVDGKLAARGLPSALVDSRMLQLTDPQPVSTDKVKERIQQQWNLFKSVVIDKKKVSDRVVPTITLFRKGLAKENVAPEDATLDQFVDFALKHTFIGENQRPPSDAAAALFTERVQFRFATFALHENGRILRQVHKGNPSPQLRPPPWATLDAFLDAADLPFRVVNPIDHGETTPYVLRLRDTRSGDDRKFSELSTGERVLVALCFWLFNLADTTTGVAHLLLDEPDAHLHPDRTDQLVRALSREIVREHGIRVIMTTHRPTTVAVSEVGATFQMTGNPTSIEPVEAPSHAIRLLTASKMDVSIGQRVVVVEAPNDEQFFTHAYLHLRAIGELDSPVQLAFMAVGKGKSQDDSGGVNKVKQLVRGLHAAGMDIKVAGIIDDDGGKHQPSEGVFKLPRYCLENYLADPLHVFAVLVEHDRLFDYTPFNIAPKQSHRLLQLNTEEKQEIASWVLHEIRRHLPEVDPQLEDLESVYWPDGSRLKYPRWLMCLPGKDVLRAVQARFGADIVNHKHLLTSVQRLGMIPTCLRDVFRRIQTSHQPPSG